MTNKEDFTKLFKDKMSSEDYVSVFDSDSWYENMLTYVAEKSAPQDKVEFTKAVLSQVVMEEFERLNIKDSNNQFTEFCFVLKSYIELFHGSDLNPTEAV